MIQLKVVLVDQQLSIRPVPFHVFWVLSATGDTTRLRTDSSGLAKAGLPVGAYAVESATPIEFNHRTYSWRSTVIVRTDVTSDVELSNDNATVIDATSGEGSLRDDERESTPHLFERLKGSVFKIEAGLAHGSDF
jgi:hypothetical protein